MYKQDIEEDLLNSTMIVLPRLMQRLLITLTQDRKTKYVQFLSPLSEFANSLGTCSLDNWQTILRRQYTRRDPQANPIGPEPLTAAQKSRATTVDSEMAMDGVNGDVKNADVPDESLNGVDHVTEDNVAQRENIESQDSKGEVTNAESLKDNATKIEESDSAVVSGVNDGEEDVQPESKDWADLDMLEKLESIHMVMEWHFQNPLRIRGIMRSDDDYASWVSCCLVSSSVP